MKVPKSIDYDDYDVFYNEIRRIDTESMLLNIGRLSAQLYISELEKKTEVFVGNLIRHEVIAYVSKFSIMKSNDFRKSDNIRKKYPNFLDFYKVLAGRYYDLTDAFMDNDNCSVLDAQRGVLRMTYEQFSHYTILKHEIGRTMLMFNDYLNMNSENGERISQKFKNLTGLSIKDYLVTGFYIFVYSVQSNGILPELRQDLFPSNLTSEKYQNYIRHNSTGYSKFRDKQEEYRKDKNLSKYEFNLLRRYPFVYTEKNKYLLCPVHPYALERISYGLVYDLMDAFRDPCEPHGNRFNEFVGKDLFEKYVGSLLKESFQNDQIWDEQEYQVSGQKTPIRSSDWILFDKDGGITLIDCKLSDLSIDTRTSDDEQKFRKNLEGHFMRGINTCERTFKHIEKGILELGVPLEFSSVNYLIVTFFPTFSGNDMYRTYIQEQNEKQSQNFCTNNFHITSIADFELICTYLLKANLSLSSFLTFKYQYKDSIRWDFRTYINEHNKVNNSLVTDFAHPLLVHRSKEVFDAVKQ